MTNKQIGLESLLTDVQRGKRIASTQIRELTKEVTDPVTAIRILIAHFGNQAKKSHKEKFDGKIPSHKEIAEAIATIIKNSNCDQWFLAEYFRGKHAQITEQLVMYCLARTNNYPAFCLPQLVFQLDDKAASKRMFEMLVQTPGDVKFFAKETAKTAPNKQAIMVAFEMLAIAISQIRRSEPHEPSLEKAKAAFSEFKTKVLPGLLDRYKTNGPVDLEELQKKMDSLGQSKQA